MAHRTTLFHSAVLISFFAISTRNFVVLGDYQNDASVYASDHWNSPDREDYSVETLRDDADSATPKPQKERPPKKHILSQTLYQTQLSILSRVEQILERLNEQGLQLEAIQNQLQRTDTPTSSSQSTPNWSTVWLPFLTPSVAPGLPISSPYDSETWKPYDRAMQRYRRRGRGGTSEFQQNRRTDTENDKPALDGVTSWISHLINNIVPGHNTDADSDDPANPGGIPQGALQRKNQNRRRKVKKNGGS